MLRLLSRKIVLTKKQSLKRSVATVSQLSTIFNEPKEDKTPNESNYFSCVKFSSLKLSEKTIECLEESNYVTATEIQAKSIPHAMLGHDICGKARTGSGKSLAFLIPAVEMLSRINFKQSSGTGVLVLTPTRELAIQLQNVAKDLCRAHNKTCAAIIGGGNRAEEAKKLQKGVQLLIATPGRLCDHFTHTKGFVFHNISMLIIDEADQILKVGFEEELKRILAVIPQERQTLLFSATLNNKIKEMIVLQNPVEVSAGKTETVSTLDQGYVMCSPENKFRLLYTFLQKHKTKKIMVFFSSCNAVKFYSNFLRFVDLDVMDIHGNQKQQKRTTTYYTFCNADSGILLCTDVAQRGLDIPDVDWIVQYDAPNNVEEYIHRVGRTARGANKSGKALLVMMKTEIGFIRALKQFNLKVDQYAFPEEKLANVTEQFITIIEKNFFLKKSAEEAYKAYLHVIL